MVQLKAVKKITVTEQIMEQIAGLITDGHLRPGDQLPNERDLAERLNVTRGRVREALRALSLVGLITIKAGEGSFVNPQQTPIPSDTIVWMFHNEIHNLHEVYAARKLIESEVYRTAAARIEEQEILYLDELLDELRRSTDVPAEAFLQLLDRWDTYIGDVCGNAIYAKLMQTIVHLRRETSLKLLGVPGSKENSVHIRSQLLESVRTRSKADVSRAVDEFFVASRRFYEKLSKP